MSRLKQYRQLFKDKNFLKSVAWGLAFLVAAGVATSFAVRYANTIPGGSVSDLVLNHLPAFPWPRFLVYLLSWGNVFFVASLAVIILLNPRYLPISMKNISLVYLLRSVFISLTHLKISDGKIALAAFSNLTALVANAVYNGNDLFFSGHTALPFISALIFWDNKKLRHYFLGATAVFGLGVLFARVHYSVDVAAAPFIVYGLFTMSKKFFKADFQRLLG